MAPSKTTSAAWRQRSLAVAAVLAVCILVGVLYLRRGSTEIASEHPVAQSDAASPAQTPENQVAQAEAYLQSHPEDGRAWEDLAPIYMQLKRYSKSVAAWRNSLKYLGEGGEREANLGEALTAEANGVVTADAKDAFVRAVTLDDTVVSARYYLGLAAMQKGERDLAAKTWRKLIADAPEGAFWVSDVRNALARLEGQSNPPVQPSAAVIADAANLPPAQQAAMIRTMVDRLAARLKQDGNDAEGWVRLIRSYKILGESEKASAAAIDARGALAGDPAKLQKFNEGLNELDGVNAAASVKITTAAPPPDHEHGAAMKEKVERLAERLKTAGSDPEDWLTLVRTYAALGEKAKITATVNDARQALASNPDKVELFNKALATINVGQ